MKIISKTLINISTLNCHASTVAVHKGNVFVAWFGGTKEGENDVDIYMAKRINNTWESPKLFAHEEGIPCWNPVLFSNNDTLFLFYKTGTPIPKWYTKYTYSLDGGSTWAAPTELVKGNIGGRGPVKNKPVKLSSGRILCPASIETETRWDAYTDITDDNFKTLNMSQFVKAAREGEDAPKYAHVFKDKGIIQPSLWEGNDGSVHMLLRSTEGYIMRSDSYDQGSSWSYAYKTDLPNNNSGLDLVKAQDNNIYLVMNPVSGNWAKRTPISLYVSSDDGESFEKLSDFETQEGEFSYPSIVTEGNKLYIVYTYKREHVAFVEIEI